MPETARLLISCEDQPGIVAAVSRAVFEHGGNIQESAQHTTDPVGGRFLMRLVVGFDDEPGWEEGFRGAFQREVAAPYGMSWSLALTSRRKRVALLASKEGHCLTDLLWRHRLDELDCEIAMVISNHDVHRSAAEWFGVPYHHITVTPNTKAQAEAEIVSLIADNCDLAVLARYMQILSPDFLERCGVPIINIHHSFLPAFAGAGPYERAVERGVKIIGATAHYVTEDLDEGPIIEQGVERIDHRDSVDDARRVGRDIERQVLARAVRAHLEDRVIVHQQRTVVF